MHLAHWSSLDINCTTEQPASHTGLDFSMTKYTTHKN